MRREYHYSVNDGRTGLSQLISTPQVLHLIRDYTINEESKDRIRKIDFKENEPFFYIKENYPTLSPATHLAPLAINADDETLKWFLLLYFVSAAVDLLDRKFLDLLDEDIKSLWEKKEYYRRSPISLYDVPRRYISRLCDSIFNIDEVFNRLFSQEDRGRYWRTDGYKEAIAMFCLTAGYHFMHDKEAVPDDLKSRNADLPFILSASMYISVITGEDFYEVLRGILKDNGVETQLDDVILMSLKNSEVRKLQHEKSNLLSLLSNNEENQRQQETAGEIITQSFGRNMPKSVIEERIRRCNEKEHREILYRLESLAKKKLSYLENLSGTPLTESDILNISKEYGVVLSEEELRHIVTIEDFIDTIIRHLGFINTFKQAVLHGETLEEIGNDNPYNLDVRIKEAEMVFGGGIDRNSVHSIEELRQYVSEHNQLLKKIVAFITEKLGCEPDEVTLSSNLTNDLGADSLDFVEILMEAEQMYGIRIPDENTACIHTVEDVYKAVLDVVRGKEEFVQMMNNS